MRPQRKCRKSSVIETVITIDDDESDCSLSGSSSSSIVIEPSQSKPQSKQSKPIPKPNKAEAKAKTKAKAKPQNTPEKSQQITVNNLSDNDNSENNIKTPQKIISSASNLQSATSLPSASKIEHKNSVTDCDAKDDVDDDVDIVIPLSLLISGSGCAGSGKDCTVLVQVDPDDAPMMDFHGASGAVGRFEANEEGVTMDLKGYRYHGMIHPGPTTLVVSMHPKMGPKTAKVESITDEFITISKATNSMARLDAIVEKGNIDISYSVIEEDVNAKANATSNSTKNDSEGGSDSKSSGPATAKKRKGVTLKKKKKRNKR